MSFWTTSAFFVLIVILEIASSDSFALMRFRIELSSGRLFDLLADFSTSITLAMFMQKHFTMAIR